jgi:hypothetical protein
LRIRELSKVISAHRTLLNSKDAGAQPVKEEFLVLGDIENYALGFQQDNVMLFAFGQM